MLNENDKAMIKDLRAVIKLTEEVIYSIRDNVNLTDQQLMHLQNIGIDTEEYTNDRDILIAETKKSKIAKVVDYIIKEVQEKSNPDMGGFQYIVDDADIMMAFQFGMEQDTQEEILDALLERKEVADAFLDTDGYDVTLFTDHAPNYVETCYKCNSDIAEGEMVYSTIIILKDSTDVIGEVKNYEDAVFERNEIREEYKNNDNVESIEISDRYCPYCLTSLS